MKAFDNNQKRPVMIHRAILGSLERCIAILAEHWKGKWPFWVSPKQVIIIPVAAAYNDYAREVKDLLYGEGYQVVMDLSDNTLGKKIRTAQVAQHNFQLVVGEEEKEAKGVKVRTRDNEQHGMKTQDEILAWFEELTKSQSPAY